MDLVLLPAPMVLQLKPGEMVAWRYYLICGIYWLCSMALLAGYLDVL